MKPRNLLYAQSGGVTAVINATAAGVIARLRELSAPVRDVYAARHGIVGVLEEQLYDTASLSDADVAALARMPGGAFGSCRFDLDAPEDNPAQYDRLFSVFEAHQIGYFLYNGGNGSMDTVVKISRAARERGYPLVCLGVPKTVDNDIEGTDCCPGFASAGKYLATSMLEAGLDLRAMASRVGRAFVMEVMGRNVGWLAAATAMAQREADDPPQIILMPEAPLEVSAFLSRVEETVARLGYCAITVSEGITYRDGTRVMEQNEDAKGYVQLGGAGQCVARMINRELGFKHHWSIPDYLQRAAGHLVSATDLAHARAVGRVAVDMAVDGRDAMMPAIQRLADEPYEWDIVGIDVAPIANRERHVPKRFIREDGFHVAEPARRYLAPLMQGELPCEFAGAVPAYRRLNLSLVTQRLSGVDAQALIQKS